MCSRHEAKLSATLITLLCALVRSCCRGARVLCAPLRSRDQLPAAGRHPSDPFAGGRALPAAVRPCVHPQSAPNPAQNPRETRQRETRFVNRALLPNTLYLGFFAEFRNDSTISPFAHSLATGHVYQVCA